MVDGIAVWIGAGSGLAVMVSGWGCVRWRALVRDRARWCAWWCGRGVTA
jgi:hypothetical protein